MLGCCELCCAAAVLYVTNKQLRLRWDLHLGPYMKHICEDRHRLTSLAIGRVLKPPEKWTAIAGDYKSTAIGLKIAQLHDIDQASRLRLGQQQLMSNASRTLPRLRRRKPERE